MKKTNKTMVLVESAVLIAIATVLSLIKLIDLPYGGSVTVASMLPLVLLSYRWGVGCGLAGAFAYGLIQQLLGLSTLSYVTTWQSVVAVVVLDYIVAFGVTGLGGLFRNWVKNQAVGLALGGILVSLLRYGCHVISGATVWAGLSIPDSAAMAYSLVYNATYMIPEALVLTVVAYYLGNLLDFRKQQPCRLEKDTAKGSAFGWLAGLLVSGGLIYDIGAVFSHLQDENTGEFLAGGLSQVPWMGVGLVTGITVSLAIVLLVFKQSKKKKGL